MLSKTLLLDWMAGPLPRLWHCAGKEERGGKWRGSGASRRVMEVGEARGG